MKIKCSKCGALALSKCPYCRNVFPENGKAALMSYCLDVTEEPAKDGMKWVSITWKTIHPVDKDTAEAAQ